jgi:hypothetical protein
MASGRTIRVLQGYVRARKKRLTWSHPQHQPQIKLWQKNLRTESLLTPKGLESQQTKHRWLAKDSVWVCMVPPTWAYFQVMLRTFGWTRIPGDWAETQMAGPHP